MVAATPSWWLSGVLMPFAGALVACPSLGTLGRYCSSSRQASVLYRCRTRRSVSRISSAWSSSWLRLVSGLQCSATSLLVQFGESGVGGGRLAGCNISPAVADPACYGVVLDVAAVLLGLTGNVSVRAVAFRDCSNYCHDVFGGEQSDASCFVRHGGLRWWWGLSPWCWRVRSERRCRALGL